MLSEVGEVHERVLNHPKIQALLDGPDRPHYDVTFVSPLFNEMGLYFGQKFESSVILYMAPVSRYLYCKYNWTMEVATMSYTKYKEEVNLSKWNFHKIVDYKLFVFDHDWKFYSKKNI